MGGGLLIGVIGDLLESPWRIRALKVRKAAFAAVK